MGSTFIAIEDAAANAQRESLAVFFFRSWRMSQNQHEAGLNHSATRSVQTNHHDLRLRLTRGMKSSCGKNGRDF